MVIRWILVSHDFVVHLPDELRLSIAIAVNLFVFIAAYKFSRRLTNQDWIGSTVDAILIHYFVQYISVCVPGLLGILSAETMLLTATSLGSTMLWTTRSRRSRLSLATEIRPQPPISQRHPDSTPSSAPAACYSSLAISPPWSNSNTPPRWSAMMR